jgi:hypothetical protein
MARSSEFVEFASESLELLGGVSGRRVFGGHGIYKDGVMFAPDCLRPALPQGRRRQPAGLRSPGVAAVHLHG